MRGGDSVELEVTITHHGPVIAGDPASGVGVAISDPGLIDGSRWVDAALDAMKSRSVGELHEAFRHWTDRVNNYAVADVGGNFGYIHAGKIPIRARRTDGARCRAGRASMSGTATFRMTNCPKPSIPGRGMRSPATSAWRGTITPTMWGVFYAGTSRAAGASRHPRTRAEDGDGERHGSHPRR